MMPIVEAVARAVCKSLGGVPIDEVLKYERGTKTVTLARKVTMYVAYKNLKLSNLEVAKQMGRKDHSTTISACTSVAKLLESEDERTVWAVEAGANAAELWKPEPEPIGIMAGESRAAALKARRRVLTGVLSDVAEEARRIDAELSKP